MSGAAGRQRTQQERREDSDARMIAAAIALFAQHGYQRTTLVAIGREAGCTGTLVTHRFGSKEGLLRAVLAHILSRFAEDPTRREEPPSTRPHDARAAPAGDARRLLGDYVEAYLADVADREGRIRALHVLMGEAIGAIPAIRGDIAEVNRVFRGRVAALLDAGRRSGAFRDDLDADATATIVVGLLRGVTMQILTEPDAITAAGMTGPAREAVLAMVSR